MRKIYRITTKIEGEQQVQTHFETKDIAEQFAEGVIKMAETNGHNDIKIETDIINVFESQEDMKKDFIQSFELMLKCEEEGLSPEECNKKYNHYTE